MANKNKPAKMLMSDPPRPTPDPPNMPYMTEFESASAIMDILKADQRETERRQEAEALAQCATMRARMRNARSKTLTGSLLEALGLGRPNKQGGRATSINVPSSSPKAHKTVHETV